MRNESLKDKALQQAMRLMQNRQVQKAMQNPRVQQAVTDAFARGARLKKDVERLRQRMVDQLDLATEDDLRSMKSELEQLRGEMARLKREDASND